MAKLVRRGILAESEVPVTPSPFQPRSILAALILWSLLSPHPAEGRVFDNLQQLAERFGKPVERRKDPEGLVDEVLVFEKDGVTIVADMLSGQAVRVSYQKLEFFKDAELAALLMANSPDNNIADWHAGTKKPNTIQDSVYVRSDRKAEARLTWNKVVVVTNIYYELQRVAKEKKHSGIADKLRGF